VIILLFGPPGCGKGTQATFITDRYGIPAISTGEMFRAECKAGTQLGKQACSILARGELVDDDIVNRLLIQRIDQSDCRGGFLLDGYPRTVAQARFLSGILRERAMNSPVILHLDVPAEALVARLAARRQCPVCKRIYNLLSQPPRQAGICDDDGAQLTRRDDDHEEVIRQRLHAYEECTGPVIQHYDCSGYHRVDGTLAQADVSRKIASILDRAAAACV
jgi:adenylate kinase